MKKIISFLGLLVTIVVFATLNPEFAGAYTREYTYTYDSIPNRTIKYELIDYNNFLELTINDTKYTIINSEYEVYNAFCDKSGTIWANLLGTSGKLYLGFYNFELQGDKDLTFHSIRSGIVEPDSEWIAIYGYDDKPECYWTLPTVEELSNFLSTGELALNYIPNPNSAPTPTPVPATEEPAKPTSPSLTETPIPTEPSSTENPVQPSSTPVANPSSAPTSKPIPTASATVDSNTTPTTVGKPASVVKKGLIISLADSNGSIIKTITLKSGKLTVNKKIIKNVKSAYFTKKGTVVYLTKSGKAYYINSKNKSKLIKAKVKTVKTSKGFATNLKLRNGKTVKIRV